MKNDRDYTEVRKLPDIKARNAEVKRLTAEGWTVEPGGSKTYGYSVTAWKGEPPCGMSFDLRNGSQTPLYRSDGESGYELMDGSPQYPGQDVMHIIVYHSIEPGHRFVPWTPAAPLRQVDEFDLTEPMSVPQTLEHVYRIHNTLDGTERNVALRVRSLSVGDVVKINTEAHACEAVGWRCVKVADLNIVK